MTAGGGTDAAATANDANDGHATELTRVLPESVGVVIVFTTPAHDPPLSDAVIDQLYTAYWVSPSRSVQPNATLPVIVIEAAIGTVTGKEIVDVDENTVGVGEFF